MVKVADLNAVTRFIPRKEVRLKYRVPVSQATVATVSPGGSAASRSAAATFAPVENPARIPSRRRQIASGRDRVVIADRNRAVTQSRVPLRRNHGIARSLQLVRGVAHRQPGQRLRARGFHGQTADRVVARLEGSCDSDERAAGADDGDERPEATPRLLP